MNEMVKKVSYYSALIFTILMINSYYLFQGNQIINQARIIGDPILTNLLFVVFAFSFYNLMMIFVILHLCKLIKMLMDAYLQISWMHKQPSFKIKYVTSHYTMDERVKVYIYPKTLVLRC